MIFVTYNSSEEVIRAIHRNFSSSQVTKTEDFYTTSPTEKMPVLILTSNGSVLKHRSNCKVLNYPDYEKGSKKFKYSRILLFYPLEPNAEVAEDRLDSLFYQRSESAPPDLSGQRLTIIDNYERFVFVILIMFINKNSYFRLFLRRIIHEV